MKRMAGAAAMATLVAASLAGCGGSKDSAGSDASPARTKVTVFAAASLKDTFEGFEKDFEAKNPDVDIVLTFAGSQDLVTQMDGGAPADVFASASSSWMIRAKDKGLVTTMSSKIFARNSLELAVQKGNPKKIESLEDLADRPELVTVRCASAVPCGELTDKLITNTAIDDLQFDTEQNSVTDTLGLVTAGEADAAIVYETDVASAENKVDGVELAGADRLANTYEIAVTKEAEESDRGDKAQDFVDLVMSHEEQMALADAGFRPVK
ncbi:molybdate ABC transporter substrate-binding protein [Dermabacter vaginalis]|uniref:molybdate ABC transporter substrate-binding protein n=1 Tax=Dermabacter vaginalis TaxID=1630135 RepID=UPI0021A3E146|nr:molybdate ABC transporter substrate-binding protein [Dermabacter vaginalis]MCT2150055.1 molybdate ABC transporter substrate-binding protein [Dermabacter vaginalis]